MNYKDQVNAMLVHMAQNPDPINMVELVKELGSGIAQASSIIEDHDRMHEFLNRVAIAINAEACAMHRQLKAVNPASESFSLEQFTPERFHG